MQSRHQIGPGNGYRSNAMGTRGVAAASRASPDGSMRGHRAYNSERRNFNRSGYGPAGGGQSRQFHPPPHPPRENDIFVEAGRLAAAYLVSKGVLPANALSGKWRNDGLRNRESAHQHFGNSALDVGPGRRNYSDEYSSMVPRNSVRGRRRTESEVNRELGRSGSWAEKNMASPRMEASSFHHDEQPVSKDGNGGRQSSSPGEITEEGGNVMENTCVKESSNNKKYPSSDGNGETSKGSDDANKFDAESVKEGRNDNNLEQKQEENKEVTGSGREGTLVSVDNVDLMKHCKSENVHTEAPIEQDSTNRDEDNSARELSEGSGIHVVDVVYDISAGNASSHQNHQLNESDVLHTPAVEEGLDVAHSTMPGQFSRSGYFPEKSEHKEQEPEERPSDLGCPNSLFTERGEKRVLDDDTDCRDGSKRPRINVQSDGCLPLSSSMENQPTLHEDRTSQSSHSTLSPEQKSLNISLFTKDHAESSEFMQEKQLFPGSFKTYDLNLVEACDVNEDHHADSVLISPSASETRKEAMPVDVDLSMSYNFSRTETNGKHGTKSTDIEVIDLEDDSAQEDQIFNNPERRGDTVIADLDGFPNNVHNANEIPDVQDGYGLMISELLGNSSPNCSIPTDLNSLHNDVALPNEEGIPGDDDSIYMSLEEIPISFLSTWEQPTQDYGKPF